MVRKSIGTLGTTYCGSTPQARRTYSLLYYLVLTGGPVLSAIFSPDGATIASAGAGCNKLWGSAYIKVWDAGTHGVP